MKDNKEIEIINELLKELEKQIKYLDNNKVKFKGKIKQAS